MRTKHVGENETGENKTGENETGENEMIAKCKF